jgi:hypothetical protein
VWRQHDGVDHGFSFLSEMAVNGSGRQSGL